MQDNENTATKEVVRIEPEKKMISVGEAKEYEEFKKQKKIIKIKQTLHRMTYRLPLPAASSGELRTACDMANKYNFFSVSVLPSSVRSCAKYLGENTGVVVSALVSYPYGCALTECKYYECKRAIKSGAKEVEIVIQARKVKEGDFAFIKKEVKKLSRLKKKASVKILIPVDELSESEIVKCAQVAKSGGASAIEIFSLSGANGMNSELVKVLRSSVGETCALSCAIGIQTCSSLEEVLLCGADRATSSLAVSVAQQLFSGV